MTMRRYGHRTHSCFVTDIAVGPVARRGAPVGRASGPEVPVELCGGALHVVFIGDLSHFRHIKFRNHKVVYRRYAGLFFCVCVDANDNELAYLEAIHLFVEVLGMAPLTFCS